MSIKTHFTPLLGAHGEGPLCYLLEIDDCRILLDCGWDDAFHVRDLDRLAEEIKIGFNAVILTHPDLAHIGALPYAIGKLGLHAPVYTTAPVKHFGEFMLFDVHTAITTMREFDIWDLEDLDSALASIICLKHDQPITLNRFGIELTPHCAGHTIGGSFWRIQKDTEKIIYAVDYNHGKERHLNPSKITMFEKPSLMITDGFNALQKSQKRKARDISLFKTIKETIDRSGEVLLPVDSGRVLELLLLLDQEWRTFKLNKQNVNIGFVCSTSYTTIDYARKNLEWMNLELDAGQNPFDFKFVTICSTPEELENLARPRVILATHPTLESGFARSLFTSWADNPNNSIIFTSKQRPNCLATQVMALKKENPENPIPLTLTEYRRIPLQGEELEEYVRRMEEKEEEDSKKNVMPELEAVPQKDMQEEPEEIIPLLPTSHFENSMDLIVSSMELSPLVVSHPMFPIDGNDDILEWDAYGEQVDSIKEAVKLLKGTTDFSMHDEDEDEELVEEETVPTKPIEETIQLEVACRMSFIDFGGRSDGPSMKNVLSAISPSKVILIHGSTEACENLSMQCLKTEGCKDTSFSIPKVGERIDVTSGTVVLKMKLSNYLANSQRHSYVNGYNVSYINGRVGFRPATEEDGDAEMSEGDEVKKEENMKDEAMETDGDVKVKMEMYLKEIPENEVPGHDTVIMGTLRLVDFRNILINQGLPARLEQGILSCNNVTVKKSSGSQFLLDGPLCDEYYLIRDLLYQQFTIL